jgi:hypothetical protein
LDDLIRRGGTEETVAFLNHSPVLDDPLDARSGLLFAAGLHRANQIGVIDWLDHATLDDGGREVATLGHGERLVRPREFQDELQSFRRFEPAYTSFMFKEIPDFLKEAVAKPKP